MQEWEDMVGNSSIRLKTAYGKDSQEIDFYNRVVNGDDGSKQFRFTKYFETKTQLFVTVTLIGYFHQRKSDLTKNDVFIRAQGVKEQTELSSVMKMIFLETAKLEENKGKKESEIWNDFLRYGDGGVEILLEDYERNNWKLDLGKVYQDLIPKIDEFVEQIIPTNEE
jgi:hypothetical protein